MQQWHNLPDCMLFSCCWPSTAGVEALPQLETLLAANNLFPDMAAVAPLAACKALQTLDLRDCKIASADGLMEILKAPSSRPQSNPLCKAAGHAYGPALGFSTCFLEHHGRGLS